MPYVTAVAGDCLSSIAARYGLTWRIVWHAPENAGLRATRKDANILYVGDVVFAPDSQPGQVGAATGRLHTFQVDVEPTYFRVQFLFQELPRANLRWTFDTAVATTTGITGGDGRMETRIDPQVETGKLRLYPPGGEPEDYTVQMGALDPIDTLSGVQQRLSNLGYDPGPVDGIDGPKTQAGVRRFQKRYKLNPSGQADPQTRRILEQVHGG